MFEPDFRLCRMNVHINVFVRDCHKHDDNRKRPRGQDVPIRVADRVQDNLVANQAPVDEEEHRIPVVFLNMRPRCEKMYSNSGPAETFLMLDKLVDEIPSEYLKDAVTKASR